MAKWDIELGNREVRIVVSSLSVVNPDSNGHAILHIFDDEGRMHIVPQSYFEPRELRRLQPGSVIALTVREREAELHSVQADAPTPEDLGQLDLFEDVG